MMRCCQQHVTMTAFGPPSMVTMIMSGIVTAKLLASIIINDNNVPLWASPLLDTLCVLGFVGLIFVSYRRQPRQQGWRLACTRGCHNSDGSCRLDTILDSAVDAVIRADRLGHITGWNKQADHIFGWNAHEALGRKISDLIIPDRWRTAHVHHLETVAHKLISALSAPYDIDGTQVRTSTSIGIATYPDTGASTNALIKAADKAMYQAKEAGRGQYRFSRSPSPSA